jgi:stage V sporulation protein AC
MNVKPKEYKKMTARTSPPSPVGKDCLWAFLAGGGICAFGQLLGNIYKSLGWQPDIAKGMVSVTLIFLAVLLTAIGVFDRIAKHAGAGTLVPITGFANAVASPAIEFKSEGFVLGVGANMFKIAGPVIVYGVVASVIYGIIYWVIQVI